MHHSGNVNDTLRDHLRSITNGASVRAMALQAGLEPSTLGRQLDGETKVQSIVAICRAYRRPILPAFIAAGYITEAEAQEMGVAAALRQATDRQLVEETLRRVSLADERHPELTEPITHDVIQAALDPGDVGGDAETDDLHTVDLRDEVDLAATRDASEPDPTRGEA
jgi:hypothetical protein